MESNVNSARMEGKGYFLLKSLLQLMSLPLKDRHLVFPVEWLEIQAKSLR